MLRQGAIFALGLLGFSLTFWSRRFSRLKLLLQKAILKQGPLTKIWQLSNAFEKEKKVTWRMIMCFAQHVFGSVDARYLTPRVPPRPDCPAQG